MTLHMLTTSPSTASLLARAALSPLLKRHRKAELPQVTYGIDGVPTDRADLAAYKAVCGLSHDGTLPATWVHVLAFPLHGALLTDKRFPFPMLGLVHIANHITQWRPLAPDARLDLRARLDKLTPHEKGALFSVLTEATANGERVWEEESVYLRRGRFPDLTAPKAEPPADDTVVEDPEHKETWELPEDLGRRYGLASGDMNPIHLHALSARAFGFKRAIAHGMWTQAHALAQLGTPHTPEQAFSLSVHFKLPAHLPGKATFRTRKIDEKQTLFEVRDGQDEKPHARGRLTLL
jgi:acyl dehydratase